MSWRRSIEGAKKNRNSKDRKVNKEGKKLVEILEEKG